MTLVRLSVRASVRSCPHNFSYVFHRTDLKFYRFPSFHMKMCMWFLIFVLAICMWFLIFVLAIFDEVLALTESNLVPATPATTFIELT